MAFPRGMKHPNNQRIAFSCKQCGKVKEIPPAQVRKGVGVFCSIRCKSLSQKKPSGQKGVLKNCDFCKDAYYAKGRQRFCSRVCFANWWRENSPRGASHRDWKPKIECICKVCAKPFLKFPSRVSSNRGRKADLCSRACSAIYLCSLQGRTSIEVSVADMLTSNGIRFREQVPMFDKWVVDFIVDDWKLIIFTDGLYWHTKPKVMAKDRGQTKYLEKCGFYVLRLTDKKIKDDPTGCISEILSYHH